MAQKTQAKDEVRDPICHMEVDIDTAEYSSNYMGKVYYFCSQDCKNEFDSNPNLFGARGKLRSELRKCK